MISPADMLSRSQVGNDAGWILRFERGLDGALALETGRDDYYADVHASLPSGLEGGVYAFTIEGMTDAHYRLIAQGQANSPSVVKLYLYWRDTASSVAGYLKNVAGLTDSFSTTHSSDLPPESLVAVLKITAVSRKLGTRRYEVTIEGREWIFDQLSTHHCCTGETKSSTQEALQQLLETNAHLTSTQYTFYPLTQSTDPPNVAVNVGTDARQLEQGRTVLSLMRDLGGRMQEYSGKYGRGMFLIRQGKLHIGERQFPLLPLSDDFAKLSLANGLLESEALETVVTDPTFDYCQHPQADADPSQGPPRRRQFKLTLKGRPDLKPGDVVQIDVPPEDVSTTDQGAFGAIVDFFASSVIPSLGGTFQNPVSLYVSAVEHKLSRTSGFVTTVTGIEVTTGHEWDTHTRNRHPHEDGDSEDGESTPEAHAAQAVRSLVTDLLNAISLPDVGEIRAFHNVAAGNDPSQTERIYIGLQNRDGQANQARRGTIARPGARDAQGVPYLTPFAWGKCGLVLPRYPGVRVLVDSRLGKGDDPVEIGALWEHGHGPDSQVGDWWLILPVDVQQSTLANDAAPAEYSGKVAQDLIDGSGNRVIETGSFTIRVGHDQLKDAGANQRPSPVADTVTIEHQAQGAKITIKSNGDIEIDSKNDLVLKATGDIKMQAANVKVTVNGSMDVS